MKTLFSFLYLTFFIFRANAQLFTLVDNEKTPIEFANVLFYNNDSLVDGTYSATKGEVHVSSRLNFDRVVISHLSFNDTVIDKNVLTKTVVLSRDKTMLEAVTVTSGNKQSFSYTGEVLMKRSNTSMLVEKSLSLRVLMLFNPEYNAEKRLKSFVFHANRKNAHEPFYVKVVFFENNEGTPGKQIPVEVITPVVKQKNNRILVNLENENLRLPITGFFIGIEFIGTEEDLLQADVDFNDSESFLDLMVNIVDFNQTNATLFQSSLSTESNGWISDGDFFDGFNEGEVLVPIFGIEVFY
jgi:hypothetical protein